MAGLYCGGFLGPFGGGVVVSMFPELGTDLGTSSAAASWSLTGYLVPFAVLMLASGTLGERWGVRRTVVGAYLVYVLASLGCALAPEFGSFLVFRALQGAANAFTTPLLLAVLASTTPAASLGSALGLFAALQAAGNTSGPLLGGLVAEVEWRWAFVGIAVVAGALAVVGLPADEEASARTGRLRDAWAAPVPRLGMVALVGWGCFGGLSFLVALRAEDNLGLSSGERGALLTGFGLLGIVTAGLAGRAVDRVGPVRCLLAGALLGVPIVAGMGLAESAVLLGLLWTIAGPANQLILVGLNAVALTRSRSPGGAIPLLLRGGVEPRVVDP